MVLELAVIAGVVVLAWWLTTRRPRATRRWLERILFARTVIVGAFLILVALALITTGVWYIVLIGAVILLLIALYVLIFRPHGRIAAWLRRRWRRLTR